jgi:transcriptional regulator of acetoin/glycerol metabolism
VTSTAQRADCRCELVQRRRRTTAKAQKPAGFDADGVFSMDSQTTAQALGINRTTLYKKMKRYGIEGE